ncbi:MAG: GntR family transcriptional regulator [Rhizobium sp.]|nr:GntR family transcriptional regulator [Rhizobium sp.]
MDSRRASHGSKEDSVADFLIAAIMSGRFVPGQRLVETELTTQLGVSRGPVREAFRRLSAEGLIEIVPNRGAMVRRLGMDEALDLFEIRTELEALAARRAAENMTDSRMRQTFDAAIAPIWSVSQRHSTADYLQENHRFHTAIMEASGNLQLVKLHQQLHLSLILAQISSSLSSHVISASLNEHRTIAMAIRDRDAAAADAAVREHLRRAQDFLRVMPSDLFRGDG